MKVVFMNTEPSKESLVKDNKEIFRVFYRSLIVIAITFGALLGVIGILVMVFDDIQLGAVLIVIGVMLVAITAFFYTSAIKSLPKKMELPGYTSLYTEYLDDCIISRDTGVGFEKELKITYGLLDGVTETKSLVIVKLITGELIYSNKADLTEGDLEELLSMLRNKAGKKYQYK